MPLLLLIFIALAYFRAYGGLRTDEAGEDETELNPPIEISDGLPWDEEVIFKEAKIANDTPHLLAKFEFTLDDPMPGELFNAKYAASQLAGTAVKPGEIFSQNNKLGPYTEAKGYQKGPMFFGTQISDAVGGGVCKVASLIYNIANLANLQIIERHNHSMPVNYVPPGQDATVAYGYKDMRFKNNTNENLLIWAGAVEETFMIAIYGKTPLPKVTWEHQLLQETPFQTAYKNDANLPSGTEKIINKGMNGCLVETRLIIEYQDGRLEKRAMGRSWYNPMPELVLRGIGEN